MYEVLRDLSQELLLPGIEHVPPNTITMLETNAKFVESFMVGLNTEMGRELLWRGFPTDQRGTYFRQFWDGKQPDIQPIDQWGTKSLGENLLGPGPDENIVLLIRGELLSRYPNAVIYAAEAKKNPDGTQVTPREPGPTEKYPIFRGTLEPDITFLGFDLTSTEAKVPLAIHQSPVGSLSFKNSQPNRTSDSTARRFWYAHPRLRSAGAACFA
jgi:hypothetical protein